MAWIEKLFATYEACKGREPPGAELLLPVSHALQQAHIEITLDSAGNFKGARVVRKEETVIPATERSAGRTGTGAIPHPLCDKIQYCAKDYLAYGGTKPSFFDAYRTQLAEWCQSKNAHTKAQAVLAYVDKGGVVADLVRNKVLHVDGNNHLLTEWEAAGEVPEVFRQLTPKDGQRDQGDAFIRWIVWSEGDLSPEVWSDATLHDAWIAFDATSNTEKGLCMVTGEESVLASSHPKRIRRGNDGAKLISANDSSGYTFRGRFTDTDGKQAAGIGFVTTQKAHSALRWLIKRQAYRNGDQVFVAWAVAGKTIPDPFADSLDLMLLGIETAETPETKQEAQSLIGDVGQSFALRLRKAIAGYGAKLNPNDDIIVMGVDSATPGRMAIIYYRELKGSEFLERIEAWHGTLAWPQNFGKGKRFVGAPAPHDVADAAFGRRLDDKLKKSTVERLLPCIVDGRPVAQDLIVSTVRRATNRVGLEHWEWEKTLGIACGLFRGWSKSNGEEYAMALEEDRTTRDYLYGRLLAVADNLEGYALRLASENRETSAARLMQRFADRPFSTWRTIELSLPPYKARLKASAKGAGVLAKSDKLLDEIQCKFVGNDFIDDRPLSGEFLLGYHCQRAALFSGKKSDTQDESTSEDDKT